MSSQLKPSRALRGLVLTLLGIAVAFTLLGGLGTSCVAFNPTGWGPRMAQLASVQWLYILIVLLSVAAGAYGIVTMVRLARGGKTAYRDALLVLGAGALTSGVQTFVSQSLRGASAPQNMRFYVTLFVLAVFLLLRLPPIWQRCGFDLPAGGRGAGSAALGAAMTVFGAIVLTTPHWAGLSHAAPDGSNWVSLYAAPLAWFGWSLLLAGIGLVAFVLIRHVFGESRHYVALDELCTA